MKFYLGKKNANKFFEDYINRCDAKPNKSTPHKVI